MKTVKIIIPVNNYYEAKLYYENVLQFKFDDGLFILPGGNKCVALKLLIVDPASKAECPPRLYFPIFNFSIDKNFLSYISKLYENKAQIENAAGHPGGYYAIISDPDGNQFEVECNNFDEADESIDPFSWTFYNRY
jgi:predicted enzyme related to lactoylglutathione lyase